MVNYGKTSTLKTKMRRAKSLSPFKLMTYYQIILDYEKAGLK